MCYEISGTCGTYKERVRMNREVSQAMLSWETGYIPEGLAEDFSMCAKC